MNGYDTLAIETTMLGKLFLAVFATTLALICGEFALFMLGLPAYGDMVKDNLDEVRPESRVFCTVSSLDDAVNAGLIETPLGILRYDKELGYTRTINENRPNGFKERKDLYGDYRGYYRVLVLGDSFTEGTGADKGQGFLQLLNDFYNDKQILFFNTGVGDYSQNNQLTVTKKYFDVIQPDLVLLGFYTGNDFYENLTPVDRYTTMPGHWILNYDGAMFPEGIDIRRRDKTEILLRSADSKFPLKQV